MAVIVTMRVKVNDYAAFRDATNWMHERGLAPGQHSDKLYQNEGDPNDLLIVQEWDDHDSFHKASDEIGPEFQKRAKTEGLDWETFVGKPAEGVNSL